MQQRPRRPGSPRPVRTSAHPRRRPGGAPYAPPRQRRRARLGQPSRRLRVALALALAVISVLGGRLVQLQGLDATAYAAQAERQRLRTVVLQAPRGEITDRSGRRLALSVDARAVFADPRQVVDGPGTATRLAPLLGVSAPALAAKLERRGSFVYLARGLGLDVAAAVRALELPGIGVLPETRRVHPGGDLAASTLGFTGQDGHGLAGIEAAYDAMLAGKDGRETMEVDAAGRQIPAAEHHEREPVVGRSVELTLDRDLQWTAQQVLARQVQATGARGGTVIVMDPRTGELLALATAPTFDANEPTKAPPAVLGNPAVSDVYEPGSVNKVVTAAAALETGTVRPDTPITVPPSITVADKVFTDAEAHGTEHLTFTGVLAKSSNIGTIDVAQRMGKQPLYDYLRRFGFGERTGLGFPGESRGILPPPEKWSGSQAGTIPIGQGVSTTALQVASAYAIVANAGVRVTPTLVRGTFARGEQFTPAPAPAQRRVISAQTAAELTTMLEAVTSDGGTAPAARIPGYRVAGKTGTARRVDPTCSCYRGYTASFVGFAPADKPELLVEVVLEDPQTAIYGGAVATPVFHDVMSFALESRRVPPTGTPAPTPRLTVSGR